MKHSLGLFSCLLLSLFVTSLTAQRTENLKSSESETVSKDFSRNAAFNTANPQVANAFNGSGAFYASNPSPSYKVDPELAYHTPEWQPTEVRMINGDTYKIEGRFRVIDQAFEVLHEGEAYELKKQQLQGLLIGNDRFMMMPDPLLKKRGAVIYQFHYGSNNYQLIEYHGAQWQEPKERQMFDTRELHRTIKPMKELVLRANGEFYSVKNHNEAVRALNIDKKSEQGKYLKKEKLKLQRSADLVQFLEYLDAQ